MYSSSVFIYVQRQIVVLLSGNSARKYDQVYSKPLTLHKGVDNKVQFSFLNQEQRPVDITGKDITCRIISYDGTEILLSKALTLDLPATGLASLVINAADIENIVPQKAYYSLEFPVGDFDFPVYVDQNAGGRGEMNIINSILPSFVPSATITIPSGQQFPNSSNVSSNLVYYTSVMNTQNNPVMTIQVTYDEFYGNVAILGSTIVDGDWYPIITESNIANRSETTGYSFSGFHPYVKMQFTSNNGAVTNILSR